MATVIVNKMVRVNFTPEIAFEPDISWYELVKLMHNSWGVYNPPFPEDLQNERAVLRMNLMLEEVGEMQKGSEEGNLIEVADGLADCLVILLGTALEYGVFVDTTQVRVTGSIIDLPNPRWESHKTSISTLAHELKAFATTFRYDPDRGQEAFEVAASIARTAAFQRIPLDDVFREVMRSNFTKLLPDGTPLRREDGKILKGPNYEPPRIRPILEGAGLL